jgi:hypothetical protein
MLVSGAVVEVAMAVYLSVVDEEKIWRWVFGC